MARKVRNAVIDSRSARRALKAGPKPHYVRLHDGLHLGYRKGTRKGAAGKWVIRRYLGEERYAIETIGTADDFVEADGVETLTFDQAQEVARGQAKAAIDQQRQVDGGPPVTVRSVVEEYFVVRDARAKAQTKAPKSDANYRLTKHLLNDKTLPDTLLIDLTAERLRDWRTGLAGELSPSTMNRMASDFRAALNGAVLKYRNRLPASIASEIKVGLKATTLDVGEADGRDIQVLPDADIRAVIVAAAEVDLEEGWDGDLLRLILVLAASGARFSQIRRMRVDDVQPAQSRLMVPPSRKGKGTKRTKRIAVSVGADVIGALKPATEGRTGSETLLLRPRWEQVPQPGKINSWRKTADRIEWLNASELRKPWKLIRLKAGLSADVVPYAFRHSSIVRGLRVGLPTRLVAALHDTSSAMIEKYYSAYIVDALGELAARAVVPLVDEPATMRPGAVEE